MNHVSRHYKAIAKHFKDHFVPHEGNRYHPHALKHRVLFGYSVVLVLLKVLVIVVPIALPSSSLYSSAITPENIINLTNQTRTNLGLGVVKLNAKLAQSAQDKANDMLQNQYFAHTSPAGVTPWSWFNKEGYKYSYAGENLAIHFVSAESVQEGWLASPTHRANIVQPKYTEIGIGVAMGTFEGFDSIFVVEHFGTPLVASITPPPAPRLTPAPKPAPTKPVAVAPTTPGQVAAAETSPTPVPVVPPPPEPVVQPTPVEPPAPVSSPVVANPVPLPTLATGPVVYDSSLKVEQHAGAYTISLIITGATSVTARLASQFVQLQQADSASSLWSGQIPFDPAQFGKSGELLSVVAVARDGTATNESLVWLAPTTTIQHLYTFNEGTDKFAKFFGFITIHNLDDSVRQFYLYFVVFLGAALLLNIFIRIRVQHVSVISHSMLVLALALTLTII